MIPEEQTTQTTESSTVDFTVLGGPFDGSVWPLPPGTTRVVKPAVFEAEAWHSKKRGIFAAQGAINLPNRKHVYHRSRGVDGKPDVFRHAHVEGV